MISTVKLEIRNFVSIEINLIAYIIIIQINFIVILSIVLN